MRSHISHLGNRRDKKKSVEALPTEELNELKSNYFKNPVRKFDSNTHYYKESQLNTIN
jgi:hypothetical protein